MCIGVYSENALCDILWDLAGQFEKCFTSQRRFENIECKRNLVCDLHFTYFGLNSSPPSATYIMHQWTGSALVQEMACRHLGAKPLPEPMQIYCQMDP